MAMQIQKGRQAAHVCASLKPVKIIGTSVLVISVLLSFNSQAKNKNENDYDLQPIEELGKRLFFENISDPNRMSCATCHAPNTGGTYNVSGVNLHQVAVTGARPHLRPQDLADGQEKTTVKNAGGLKPPTNQYVSFIHDGEVLGLQNLGFGCGFLPCGGAFWNGRATGLGVAAQDAIPSPLFGAFSKYLGPLADQAFASPFLNPVEQNHKSEEDVCQQVESTKWGGELYYLTWNEALDCQSEESAKLAFARFAISLAAWQMSKDNNRFDSKRDIALENDTNGFFKNDNEFDIDGLTAQEERGHDLFYGRANCSICHGKPGADGTDKFERYTDDSYHAIGVPRNYELPGSPEPNIGLFDTLNKITNLPDGFPVFLFVGTHKTPTLRNVDKRPGKGFTKAYMHNGWFKSLESVVNFYNTSFISDDPEADTTANRNNITRCPLDIVTEKDALANNCWPEPEFPNAPLLSINIGLTGNLGLSEEDEAALVAYLKTLTDTTTVEPPAPYKSSSNPPKQSKK